MLRYQEQLTGHNYRAEMSTIYLLKQAYQQPSISACYFPILTLMSNFLPLRSQTMALVAHYSRSSGSIPLNFVIECAGIAVNRVGALISFDDLIYCRLGPDTNLIDQWQYGHNVCAGDAMKILISWSFWSFPLLKAWSHYFISYWLVFMLARYNGDINTAVEFQSL